MDRSPTLEQGSIPTLLLKFSLPAIVGMMAQALYYIVDRIFVGRAVGPDGIAGTTVAYPAMLVLLAFGMLVGFGATVLISIRLGQRNKAEAELVLGNAAVLLVAVSLAATVGGLWFLDPLLKIFGASDHVLPYARDYLGIIVLGTTFQIVGFGLNAVIRGEGNPKIAMLTMLIGVLLNVALAPLFVFGFHWGMKGAALATVISQAVSAIWVLAYFLGGRSVLKLRLGNLRLDRSICGKILAFGAPLFTMQIAASVMNGILNNQLPSLRRRLGHLGHGDRLRAIDDDRHADLRHQPGGAAHHRLQLRGRKAGSSETNAGHGHPGGQLHHRHRLRGRTVYPRPSGPTL